MFLVLAKSAIDNKKEEDKNCLKLINAIETINLAEIN
jgi:hypothetical protein